jgi:hypothetical protein
MRAARRFPIRLEPRFGLVLRLFGDRDGNAVDLDDDELEAVIA